MELGRNFRQCCCHMLFPLSFLSLHLFYYILLNKGFFYIVRHIDPFSISVFNLLCNHKLLSCPLLLLLKFMNRFKNVALWFLWSRVGPWRRRVLGHLMPMLCVILSKGVQPRFLRARHGIGTEADRMMSLSWIPSRHQRRESGHWNARNMCQQLIRSTRKGFWSRWRKEITSEEEGQRRSLEGGGIWPGH